jgi:hypothetical protein
MAEDDPPGLRSLQGPMNDRPPTLFLLSPANLNGLRAKQLSSPRAQFGAAVALRSEEGVPIEEAFAFMSALYFRGKVAYSSRFGAAPEAIEHANWVIAPGFGLVPFGWRIDMERFRKLKRTDVDVSSRNYRTALTRDAKAIAEKITAETQVVLLGSIATGKYVDILWPIFGSRLRFPACFVGLGDMSRGGLMLRAARSGEEFEYATLDVDRHRKRR